MLTILGNLRGTIMSFLRGFFDHRRYYTVSAALTCVVDYNCRGLHTCIHAPTRIRACRLGHSPNHELLARFFELLTIRDHCIRSSYCAIRARLCLVLIQCLNRCCCLCFIRELYNWSSYIQCIWATSVCLALGLLFRILKTNRIVFRNRFQKRNRNVFRNRNAEESFCRVSIG